MASGAPPLHPMTARIGSTNLATLTARRLNGWMNVKIAPPSGWTPDFLYWIFPTRRNPGCVATQWQPSHLPSFTPAIFTYVHLVFGDQEPQLAVRTPAFLGESDDSFVTETSALELINIWTTWFWRTIGKVALVVTEPAWNFCWQLFTFHFFPLILLSLSS